MIVLKIMGRAFATGLPGTRGEARLITPSY